MNIVEYVDREMLAISLAHILVGELKNTLDHEETAVLVVPGGTTPGPIFDVLCAADIEWARVHVMLSDERWVPADHARSNARLLKERLLAGPAAQARFTPFFTPDQDVNTACAQISQQLETTWPISVLMLGMGADMHTASLFPNADGLEAALAADAPALCPIKAQGQEQRVTLSAHTLNTAVSKHIVITGEDKRNALMQAPHLDTYTAPIAAVLNDATIHWAK